MSLSQTVVLLIVKEDPNDSSPEKDESIHDGNSKLKWLGGLGQIDNYFFKPKSKSSTGNLPTMM